MSLREAPDPVALGKRIRRARNDADLSQYDLAQAIGSRERNIQRWELGLNAPGSLMWVLRIAEVTGKPVEWFFDTKPKRRAKAGAAA